MDYKDEFVLMRRLLEAENILKKCLPFIETWYEASAAGMGLGALQLSKEIKNFIEEGK